MRFWLPRLDLQAVRAPQQATGPSWCSALVPVPARQPVGAGALRTARRHLGASGSAACRPRGAAGGSVNSVRARAWCWTRPTDTWSAGALHQPDLGRRHHRPASSAGRSLRWPDGRVKTSATWLIEPFRLQQGLPGRRRGETVQQARTGPDQPGRRLRSRGRCAGPSGAGGVHDRFGIWLVPEPVLVGLEL